VSVDFGRAARRGARFAAGLGLDAISIGGSAIGRFGILHLDPHSIDYILIINT
jgi:hypothetical protein